MITLLLISFLILAPLDLLVIYLILWRNVRRYRRDGDRARAVDAVARAFGAYLALSSSAIFLAYWAVLRLLLTTFALVLVASAINVVLCALLYAVLGSLLWRNE